MGSDKNKISICILSVNCSILSFISDRDNSYGCQDKPKEAEFIHHGQCWAARAPSRDERSAGGEWRACAPGSREAAWRRRALSRARRASRSLPARGLQRAWKQSTFLFSIVLLLQRNKLTYVRVPTACEFVSPGSHSQPLRYRASTCAPNSARCSASVTLRTYSVLVIIINVMRFHRHTCIWL